jgi:hypothetical protein
VDSAAYYLTVAARKLLCAEHCSSAYRHKLNRLWFNVIAVQGMDGAFSVWRDTGGHIAAELARASALVPVLEFLLQ